MAKDNDFNYCPNCGADLPLDAKFCPDCGNVLAGPDGLMDSQMKSRLTIIAVFSLMFAILAIISGISCIAQADVIIDTLKQDADSWAQIISQFADMGYSEEDAVNLIKSVFLFSGVASLIAGIGAGIGGACAIAKKYWVLGLIGLIVGTVLMFPTILGLIVGIIFIYLYSTCKPAFATSA